MSGVSVSLLNPPLWMILFLWLNLGCNQYWSGLVYVFIKCPGAPDCQAQLAFVLVLKPLGTHALAYSMIRQTKVFVAFPWVETSTGPGGFMICVYDGNSRWLNRKWFYGNSRWLNRKWFYGEAGNGTCYPWFTLQGIALIHYTTEVIRQTRRTIHYTTEATLKTFNQQTAYYIVYITMIFQIYMS